MQGPLVRIITLGVLARSHIAGASLTYKEKYQLPALWAAPIVVQDAQS